MADVLRAVKRDHDESEVGAEGAALAESAGAVDAVDGGGDGSGAGAAKASAGADAAAKGKRKKRRLSPTEEARVEFRHAIVEAIKEEDAEKAVRLFDEAVSSGRAVVGAAAPLSGAMFRVDVHIFSQLVYMCGLKGRKDDGVRVWEMMRAAEVQAQEPGWSGVIKLCAATGELETAQRYLDELVASDVKPRMRSFVPLMAAYAETGTEEGKAAALRLYNDVQRRGFNRDCTEKEYAPLLHMAAKMGDLETGLMVLKDAMEMVYTFTEPTLKAVEAMFCKCGWNTGRTAVGSDGVVPEELSGDKRLQLRSLDLTDEELAELTRLSEEEMTKGKRRRKQFEQFKTFLERRGPFDVVIDGANIGYLNQNFGGARFSHLQVELVTRFFEDTGKKVLLVLHSKWFHEKTVHASEFGLRNGKPAPGLRSGEPMEARTAAARGAGAGPRKHPADMTMREICDGWVRRGVVYQVQPGNNDDWYWMYAAVRAKRNVQVVSNDQMRDRHFRMSAPRHFLKWRERHTVKPSFANSRDDRKKRPQFRYPPKYSHRVHPSNTGDAWFLPKSDGDGEWLVAWRS